MGQSQPPRSNLDLVNSYARRRGDDVELVLSRPAVTLTRQHPLLLLECRGMVVEALCDIERKDGKRRLVARVERDRLANGIWRLTLKPGTGPVVLGARLLVQGERPLVLLMGQTLSTARYPRPRPKVQPARPVRVAPAPPPPPPAPPPASLVRRAARRARRVLAVARGA